jgi:pyruvate/2-oxoglutarate dehydrogenase complex dihydrolipoamide acyltransferase (E2) component
MSRYQVRTPHPFFDLTRSIGEREIRPGLTITFMAEVDLSAIERVRAASRRKPSYTAFVAAAVAGAVREFPYANRRIVRRPYFPFRRTALQTFERVDIAVACERDIEGIEVATWVDVLRDADTLSLTDITGWLAALARTDETTSPKWKAYRDAIERLPRWLSCLIIGLPVHVPWLWDRWRGGAVLISSPARYGVDAVLGSWTCPIGVSFGLVRDRPVVVGGKVEVRPTFSLTVNWDRRVMAGAQAARFFRRIVERLERADVELARESDMPTAKVVARLEGTEVA